MIKLRDMLQWRNLITPLIVPFFFWSVLIASPVAGIFGLLNGIMLIADNPLVGMLVIALTIPMVALAIIAARLISEFFLISFRTNAHLYRIRTVLEAAEHELSKSTQQTHLSNAA